MSSMKVVARGVVYDATNQGPDRRFCFSPSPVRLSDGRLIVAFRAGSSKDAADENIIIRLSADGGASWETTFDKGFDPFIEGGVRYGWRGARLIELAPGHLLCAFSLFDRSVPGRPLSNPETHGTLSGRILVADSFDDGRSWVDMRVVDTAPFTGIAISGPLLRLHDGRLVLCYETWKDYDDPRPGRHRVVWRISDDGGRTFGPNITFAHDPEGKAFHWDGRHAVAPDSGKVIGTYWTYDVHSQKDLNIHVNWGSADGQQWTETRDTGIRGQITSPLALSRGRVLITYVHRHDPGSLRAVLSDDFGKTWDTRGELVFYESQAGREPGVGVQHNFSQYWEDMYRWTFGQPAPIPLPNGEVFVAFYCGTPQAMSMHWVRLAGVA
jgi:hypothetical protein